MGGILGQKISALIISALLIIALYFVTVKGIIIILPFFLGYLLSKLFLPIIKKLDIKNKWIRGIISFIFILVIISLFSLLFYLLGKQLIDFLSNFIDTNPQLQDSLLDMINRTSDYIGDYFNNFNFQDIITNTINTISEQLVNISRNLLNSTINFFTFLPEILLFIIVLFISAFFFTKDHELITKQYDKYISKYMEKINENEYVKLFKDDVLFVVAGYVKAQLILMIITSIVSAIGLFLINVDNFLPKALIIGLVDALPMFGTGLFYIPWAISKFIVGNHTIGLYLLILYGITTIIRQSLEPKIFSQQIGLYPLITLLSIYGGLKIFGIIGIFIGPILVITAKTVVQFQRDKANINE